MDNNKISFDTDRIAQGYAKRPWIHKEVIEQILDKCDIKNKFNNGLDVGCGAGLSSKALKLICRQVTGTDISPQMIDVCKNLHADKDYLFYVSKAEETKIPEVKYDIVTAAGVINWVDRNLFLKNMNSVMEQQGLLLVYDFWITDKMQGNLDYTSWYNNEYLNKFPKPLRDERVWSEENVSDYFTMFMQTEFEALYEFDINSFIDFMMIQSNVNVKINEDIGCKEEIRSWFEESLKPIFGECNKKLVFDGYIWLMEKK